MPLPSPTTDQLAHSARLTQHIAHEIETAGGWISFARYMELALYAPGLGYYSAGQRKFGPAGDFTTAPEMTPFFARTLARPVGQWLAQGGGSIIEFGAGTGALAADLLRALAAPPDQYLIVELSADLRERQRNMLAARAPEHLARVRWLDQLPETITGVIIGNEVLDAMPVHVLHWQGGSVFERGVAWNGSRFHWQERPVAPGALREAALAISPGQDYISELSLAIPAFIESLAARLTRGKMLFIDYGFPAREFYHPQRDRGTLMCHYRHHAHDDPFHLPGLEDITVHVNFTALMEAAETAGLTVHQFTNQARFLLEHGLTEILGSLDPANAATYLPIVNQVQRLISPAEMGELFKVVVLDKG